MAADRVAAALALKGVDSAGRGDDGPLRGLSLVIPAGVFCVATGASGCGASTLVRFVLDRQGDALLVDPKALGPRLSVYDNIARGLARRGAAASEVEARALEAAQAMDLAPLLARATGGLSFEQRWRVAFARALAHRPPLLAFDEPFAGAGPVWRRDLRGLMRRVHAETGATVVAAFADPGEALALADLLVVLDRGEVLAAGAPLALYDQPPTAAVARLTGPFGINLLPVRANQTGLSLETGATLGGASAMTTATFAVLGVRPEHLAPIGPEGEPPNGARLPLDVDRVESTGADTLLSGHVGPHPVTARVAGRIAAKAGERVVLGVRGEHLHMFDAETLTRL
ncbi:ABC transporter ATP-binding protein [Methylopila turkensis]|uniref:Sn-glycerol-3-phosphate import ATP-binding protein UgpC n=1 Tax=Methylopila turkensis TaxID=1437816 RepID=A0A9W6JQD6_9HYPH|nr:ABC transporter ATP-binding protein [Methylopila turkensis]GLK81841.1 sn-glycerol-3-phosphate import ATP-binding protein UgpC [Methylopila turkensis]